jgi:hypothetical protein
MSCKRAHLEVLVGGSLTHMRWLSLQCEQTNQVWQVRMMYKLVLVLMSPRVSRIDLILCALSAELCRCGDSLSRGCATYAVEARQGHDNA